jgi:cobyrinic acid a,c-diamide synthase
MTKKMKLNYTKGKIISKNIISDKLHDLQGHEFHYSELDSVSSDSKFVYELDIGEGIKNHKDGMIQYNTLASYGHLYFDSSNYAQIFVKNCINNSRR